MDACLISFYGQLPNDQLIKSDMILCCSIPQISGRAGGTIFPITTNYVERPINRFTQGSYVEIPMMRHADQILVHIKGYTNNAYCPYSSYTTASLSEIEIYVNGAVISDR